MLLQQAHNGLKMIEVGSAGRLPLCLWCLRATNARARIEERGACQRLRACRHCYKNGGIDRSFQRLTTEMRVSRPEPICSAGQIMN
jgi:hypothetical protein